MRKLMVVQPINGRPVSEIKAARLEALQTAAAQYHEPFTLLESAGEPGEYYESELLYLAECVKQMAQADVVCFTGDWVKTHLCCVLHDVAVAYELPRLYR